MKYARCIYLAGIILALAACNSSGAGESTQQAVTLPVAPALTSAAPTNTVPPASTKATAKVPDTEQAQQATDCPVTQPPDPRFTPPTPYPPDAPWAGSFWYGTDLLWTRLPNDGTWAGLPNNPGGYTQKVFWWRDGYDWTAEPQPQLIVTGRRLDAPAPPLNTSQATNAYAEDIKSAMLVGVDFPTHGCWEITGRYADQELSFVVLVVP